MTWEFREMFSYVSSTFLYLLEANTQAIDSSFFTPEMYEQTHDVVNDYFHLSVIGSLGSVHYAHMLIVVVF